MSRVSMGVDEWVEVDACRNTLLVPRTMTLERSTDFDCNPIATQRDIIGCHILIRAEPLADENACIDGLFTTVRHSVRRA